MCSTERMTGATMRPRSGADAQLPGRLAGLSVRRQVLVLAIWPFLEQLLGFCVGFVDTAIAGRLSVAATEAIAVAAYIGWLLVLLFGAVGVGAGGAGGSSDWRPTSPIGARRSWAGADGRVRVGGRLGGVRLSSRAELRTIAESERRRTRSGDLYLRILAVAVPAHGCALRRCGVSACLRGYADSVSDSGIGERSQCDGESLAGVWPGASGRKGRGGNCGRHRDGLGLGGRRDRVGSPIRELPNSPALVSTSSAPSDLASDLADQLPPVCRLVGYLDR